jgi:hypothetical protein
MDFTPLINHQTRLYHTTKSTTSLRAFISIKIPQGFNTHPFLRGFLSLLQRNPTTKSTKNTKLKTYPLFTLLPMWFHKFFHSASPLTGGTEWRVNIFSISADQSLPCLSVFYSHLRAINPILILHFQEERQGREIRSRLLLHLEILL